MIVVVVTDETPTSEATERMLRRLTVQHDVLWLTLRDAEPVLAQGARARRDADTSWVVPDFVHGDLDVIAELAAQEAADTSRRDELLRRLEITHVELGGQEQTVGALLAMLNSCAPGVAVVNIDNGFGAAVHASRIARNAR